jgi:hypothetical protein
MSRMNKAWKTVQPKPKPSALEGDLRQALEAEDVREHSAGEDADAIARNAVHRRSQGLAPLRRDILLVRSG